MQNASCRAWDAPAQPPAAEDDRGGVLPLPTGCVNLRGGTRSQFFMASTSGRELADKAASFGLV